MLLKLFNKNKKKKYEFQHCYLIITLEVGWVQYLDKEKYDLPLSFFKEENGIGALQISVTTSEDKKKFDIHEIISNDERSISDMKEYILRRWMIYEDQKKEDKRFFKYFYFVQPGVIVYVTYNCNLDDFSEREFKEAIKISKSIDIIWKID